MNFGKRTTIESYFNGDLKSTKTEYSIPELVKNRADALTEIMKCLDLIDKKETSNMTITIQADPKTHNIRLITKSYIVEKDV